MGDPVLKSEHRWKRLPGSPGVSWCAECGALRLSVPRRYAPKDVEWPLVVECRLFEGQCRGRKSGGNSEGSVRWSETICGARCAACAHWPDPACQVCNGEGVLPAYVEGEEGQS